MKLAVFILKRQFPRISVINKLAFIQRFTCCVLLFNLCFFCCFAQDEKEPKVEFDYHVPIKLPINLAGTFGELRSNHFHAGIDIKTQGTEGYKLYSIEEGYVSRIKVSKSGYGNALYISHPNGYTSVYAHMQVFEPEIQNFIDELQYELRKFEIDYFMETEIFTFQKGDVIGLSGNSGSSSGPHLHFEIRETATEHPINPLKYGFSCKDQIAPKVRNIRFYNIENDVFELSKNYFELKKTGNSYFISEDIIYLEDEEVAFAIQTYDHQSNTVHKNGIYNIKLFVNDTLEFSNTFDKLDFSKIRYINSYMDYGLKKTKNATYNRVFKLPGNNLDFYDVNLADGRVKLNEIPKDITIEVYDANENFSTVNFKIAKKSSSKDSLVQEECNNLVKVNESFNVTNDSLKLFIPEGSVYQNQCLKITKSTKKKTGVHSPIYKVCNSSIPSHNYFQISIIPDSVALQNIENTMVCYINSKNTLESCSTYYNGTHFTGFAREFGEFYLAIDTMGPLLKRNNFKSGDKITKDKTLSYYCKDAICSLKTYNAFVNDNWTLMSYNLRRNGLYIDDKRFFVPGKNEIRILVTDELDNLTEQISYVYY